MVEYITELDEVFHCLGDATRRDILKRVALAGQAHRELSVSEVAAPYDVTLAAISKHLMILEKAKLIRKRREGNHNFIRLTPRALKDADTYLQRYRELWEDRLNRLEDLLKDN